MTYWQDNDRRIVVARLHGQKKKVFRIPRPVAYTDPPRWLNNHVVYYSCGGGSGACFVNARTGRRVRLRLHHGNADDVASSPSGSQLAWGGCDDGDRLYLTDHKGHNTRVVYEGFSTHTSTNPCDIAWH